MRDSSSWSYEKALDYVAGYGGRGWRLGLDRMEALMKGAGLYDFAGRNGQCSFIHVAGTNGKGTVTAMIEALLRVSGKTVGATFSPYVVDPRERIRVGNELVREEIYAKAAYELAAIAEQIGETELGLVTEFEFKTAMAFWVWRHEGCDWAVAEVGLGGRLDATNVLQPKSCAIVSISLDHTEHLGLTEDSISREKAGILKPGVIGVIGNMSDDALNAIEEVGSGVSAELWRVGQEVLFASKPSSNSIWLSTPARDETVIEIPDFGHHSAHNAAIAISALDAAGVILDRETINHGFEEVRLLGRMQWAEIEGVRILLDGAHNSASAESLAKELRIHQLDGRIHLVFGMLQGHDPRQVFSHLRGLLCSVALTKIDYHRSLAPDELLQKIEPEMKTTLHESTRNALLASLESAREHNGTVLITGSFYLVGEALKAIETLR